MVPKLRRFATALGLCLAVVLLPSTAWSAPLPAPVPTSGAPFVAHSWECSSTTSVPDASTGSSSLEQCAVTGWAELPAAPVFTPPAPLPNPLPVTGTVLLDPQSLPLPVVEQSPQTSSSTCPDSSASPSPDGGLPPSSSPSPVSSEPPPDSPPVSPSPSPELSPTATATAPPSTCGPASSVTVRLDEKQALPLWLILSTLTFLLSVPALLAWTRR